MPTAALPYIAAATGLLGTVGSLAGDKGEPIETKAQESPELTEYRKKMLEYLGSKMGQGATPNPWLTQPNSPGMQAMNNISSIFYGKGINIPGGYGGQQAGQQGGQGYPTMPGGQPMPNVPTMPTIPQGMSMGGGMPGMTGMPMQGQMPFGPRRA